VDQKGRVDCFQARGGESLLDFCVGDGAHGLLEASIVSQYMMRFNSIQILVIITDSNLKSTIVMIQEYSFHGIVT
jgi:hypothetical protein